METSSISEAKYQKLASEYAKLRAQASVLRKAVLEEQAKNGTLRDHLRQREAALRRSEQEVDSLGFRNKQLEHRVAALQEEIATHEGRKREKDYKRNGKNADINNHTHIGAAGDGHDPLIFEELQKKIMENAHLTSLIDDKERDLQLYGERIENLELMLEKRANEQSDLEKRLRRDLETIQNRNTELETKLVEAASMLGSEDALSASGSDNTPIHNNHAIPNVVSGFAAMSTGTGAHTSEERIAFLEKEVSHWRAQYEIAKLKGNFVANNNNCKESSSKQQSNNSATTAIETSVLIIDDYCSCSSAAAAINVASNAENKSAESSRESLKEPPMPPTKEQLIYNHFSLKFEELLYAKYMSESRVQSFEIEADHLQNCLENATQELKGKDDHILSINQALQILEEDLATTRINYEEQISVLTEQIVNLSDQLAACK